MREAKEAELAIWDQLIAAQGKAASVLQGQAFARIKQAGGWRPSYWLVDGRPVMMLGRSVPGLGQLNYVPGGPACNSLDETGLLAAGLSKLVPGFLLQLEPELPVDEEKLKRFLTENKFSSRSPIQPNRSTVLIDLAPEEDDILASFHQKTRYNVRLAERHGVKVEPSELTPENMRLMYGLMASSQERGAYYLRPYPYFETAWKIYSSLGSGQLFFAKYEGKVLAGAFVTFLGQKGLYKDGGSTREHREVQPMYALQWEAMRWLKAKGVTVYDMHGVPPADQLDNPNHPFAGLARFKTGFQPQITTYAGVIQVPLRPGAYRIWQSHGERLYAAWLYRTRGQSLY